MIIIKKTNGEESVYSTADAVTTKPTEYLIVANGFVVAQIPRERVDEIAFVPNKPRTPDA